MLDASSWGVSVARAQKEARKRYPKQPERARHYHHKILGVYDGPYHLEPLTIGQRIAFIFGADHALEIPSLSDLSPWGQFVRGFRFFFTGR